VAGKRRAQPCHDGWQNMAMVIARLPDGLSMSAGGQLQRQPRTRRQQANRDRMHEYRLTLKTACDSRVGRGANKTIAWILHHE
jgi:hypothetical protein